MLYSIVQAISPLAFMVFLGWIPAAPLATSRMWSDFSGKPDWRYQELPPFLLPELEKDLPAANDSELSRVIWFWLRRPKSTLYETGAAIIIEGGIVVLSLITAFGGRPEISGSELSFELIPPLFAVAIEIGAIMHQIKLIRWRREYELSIDRLIRTIIRRFEDTDPADGKRE